MTQADSFIVTLRSPLPPKQHFLAAIDGREHSYFVCSQSALPLASWEVRSTSRGSRGGLRGGNSEDSKLGCFHTLQIGGQARAHRSPWLLIKGTKQNLKLPPTSHHPVYDSQNHFTIVDWAQHVHPSLRRRAAFPCVGSSPNFSPPSSPTPLAENVPALLLPRTFLYTVLEIMFNRLSKMDSPWEKRCFLRYRLQNLEINLTIISMQYIDHWIHWPLNLPSWRPLVVLPRGVSIERGWESPMNWFKKSK